MRSTDAIARFIRSQYPSAVVEVKDGHIVVDMNESSTNSIWAEAYDDLLEVFNKDSDIRTISGCYTVGIHKVDPYFSFAFTFYQTR
ncbi:hypothetical protein SmaMPs15_000055 [Stenotrophomonas maltophilia phage vB_SmaM_Ps15]|uniref:Uncharacterized protein n=1 Tax=Stenotrophomonas maltophilia phage vB_SmaM_Ps15 TaxID=3071007 RepID=A0AAE9JV79_9CAUD|nr:hypothetical protein PQC01_gp055 [Stenotrophomonas maltophilia phage vB_SmaM_Ps15]UMO77206.1 hypothetical protein SmaMPs15_000055 [Stenotrophomonas maltophilia phage vB_SmaM_Ps15]